MHQNWKKGQEMVCVRIAQWVSDESLLRAESNDTLRGVIHLSVSSAFYSFHHTRLMDWGQPSVIIDGFYLESQSFPSYALHIPQ